MDARTFLHELDALFELDTGSIQPTSVIRDIPGWSSLTFMGLIALVDDELDVTLTPDAVLRCRTVADLLREIGVPSPLATPRAA